MKRLKFLPLFLLITIIGCKSGNNKDLGDGVFANIQTNKGDIIVKLEHEATPVTVANFVCLSEGNNPFVSEDLKDKKYYDGIIFHRVIKGFMIQGGDPTGTGSGSPGYKFEDEIVDSLVHDGPGILSMANAGPNTNGSQFFITHAPTPFLNGKHAVFGKVVEGLEVVDSIANVETVPQDKPATDVVMNSVKIIRNGKEAKDFDAVKIMNDYFENLAVREEERKKLEEGRQAIAVETVGKLVEKFAEHKKKTTKLPSGLELFYIKKGNGEKPKIGNKALVNYAGYFEDGRLFDSNIREVEESHNKLNSIKVERGFYTPFPMDYSPDNQLVAGFREALLSMRVGDKVRAFVPSHLGYGSTGLGKVIPPNTNLVFDIEITGIE